MYVDEAGFPSSEVRRHERKSIEQRATVPVPRPSHITMCASVFNNGVLCHIATIGPYNTENLITSLDTEYKGLVPGGLVKPGMTVSSFQTMLP